MRPRPQNVNSLRNISPAQEEAQFVTPLRVRVDARMARRAAVEKLGQRVLTTLGATEPMVGRLGRLSGAAVQFGLAESSRAGVDQDRYLCQLVLVRDPAG